MVDNHYPPYIVKSSVSASGVDELPVRRLPSHLIPVTEVSFILIDIKNLVKSAEITTIPATTSVPGSVVYVIESLLLNVTSNSLSVPPSTEQVIFLCVEMGRYKGPGGSTVTME